MPLTLTTSFGFSLPADSCSFVRLIVLDISGTKKHFEFIEQFDTVLDAGGVQFEPILNVILGFHESHGFQPNKMGCCEELIDAVMEHLNYEYPCFMDSTPFDVTECVRNQIKAICEIFSLSLAACNLKGKDWAVVGYRSTFHPIIGKLLQ